MTTLEKCLKEDVVGIVIQAHVWLPADSLYWSLHMSSFFECVKEILLPHRIQHSAALLLVSFYLNAASVFLSVCSILQKSQVFSF